METATYSAREKYDLQASYLVFSIADRLFALPHEKIVTVLDSPPCTKMPGLSEETLGVMDFMGKPVSVYDFRSKAGVPKRQEEADELFGTLMKRKQDHLNWVNRLKEEVYSGSVISVETNPHNCLFGKWYDAYHTDNLALSRYLKQFDKPHRYIHGIADKAKVFMEQNDLESAKRLIHDTEQTRLAELIGLFDGIKGELQKAMSQYVIVVTAPGGEHAALAVDEPRYFGTLEEIIYPIPVMVDRSGEGFVDACGFFSENDHRHDVLVIDLDCLLCDA